MIDRRAFLAGAMPAFALAGIRLDEPWPSTPASRVFLDAVRAGDVARIRRLLADDATLVYARDTEGRSAYVLAHIHRHEPVAALIEEQGIAMDVVEAVLARRWERVDEIAATAYGIVNADHPFGGTAMHAAAFVGIGADLWRVQQHGGDPNVNPRGAEGVTPARLAVDHPDPWTAMVTAANLLGNGARPNEPQPASDSVLHGAAATGDLGLIRLVLRKGGDPDALDGAGRRPVDVAEAAGHPAAATLLRDHRSVRRDHRSSRFAYAADGSRYDPPTLAGYDPRLVGRTVGSAHGDLEATRENTGRLPALAHAVSVFDEAAVEAAGHTGRREVAGLLLERGAPYSLPTALTMGDVDWARRLLDEDPRRVDERGAHDFPVTWYISIGEPSVEKAELLLDFGADIEQENLGTTALHYAVRNRAPDVTAVLLERGADPNAVGRRFAPDGETPLDIAIARDEPGIAALLRAHGGRASG